MQIPDDAVTITDDTITVSLKNASLVDQFSFPGGAANNLGIAGAPATLSFDITYTKSGASRHVKPTSTDPLSPFNWEGRMWMATNSGTFSLAYNDGTFSASGTFSSSGNFGEMGTEKNGSFARPAKDAAVASLSRLNSPARSQLAGAAQYASVPKFRGRVPVTELIH